MRQTLRRVRVARCSSSVLRRPPLAGIGIVAALLGGGEALAAAPTVAPRAGGFAGTSLQSTAVRAPASAAPYCDGEYADDLSALASRARQIEPQPYSFCVRNTVVYECLSYGPDGNEHRARSRAVAHGTAFAYRQQAGETLLLTNEHVAEWPAVTDAEHPVDGVPPRL